MATIYPSAIDNSTSLPLVIDNVTEVQAVTVNRLRFAILAIEQALGINPQGTFTAFGVSARLDNVDSQITNLTNSLASAIAVIDSTIANLTGEAIDLGTPTGGFATGLTTLQSSTPITEAINIFNNLMLYLAPAQPQSMQGLSIDAISSIPIFVGKVADVTGHSTGYFKPSFPAGSTYSIITKTQSFTLTTHNTSDSTTGFSDADKGIVQLLLNGTIVSTFNLGIAFDEAHRADPSGQGTTYDSNTGSAVPPLKTIDAHSQIYSIALFNNFPLWQKGVIHITNTTLSPGYNTFVLQHIVNLSIRTSQTFELFYDNGALDPLFPSTPTLTITGSSNANYLSGIKYLTTGDTLLLQATINNAFVNTYIQTPISYSFTTAIPAATSNLSDSAISVGPTGDASVPNSTDHITVNKTFTITQTNQQTLNEIATITYANVYGNTFTASSASQNILVNTYNTNVSTNTTEVFLDEKYRLMPDIDGYDGYVSVYPNDYTGIPPVLPPTSSDPGYWDPSIALSDGYAQIFNSALIYPHQDFSTGYLPTQTGGTNYSTFSNSNSHNGQVYYRAMIAPGSPHSLGTLTIGGIVLTDLTQMTPNVKVEMKLPGTTGWLDFSLPFNSGTFSGITGDGCRTSFGGNSFGWSTGVFSTATAGYCYILRITLFNSTRQITSLTESFS